MNSKLTKTNLFFVFIMGLVPSIASASALSDLAANMQPGEWAELSTQGFDNGDLLYTTRNNPGDSLDKSNRIIDFAESGAWDPIEKQFMFIGAPHGKAWRFIIYDEESNTWRDGPLPRPCMAYGGNITEGTPDTTYCGGHGFDWNAFDPETGRFFHTYWKFGPELDIYTTSSNQWSRSDSPPSNIENIFQSYFRYSAMEWFPEMNSLLTLSDGKIMRIDVDANTWEEWPERFEMGGYHNVMAYSKAQKIMLFGGGNHWAPTPAATPNSRDLYWMNAAGDVKKVTNVPFYIRLNDQTGGGHPGSLITADPVSGKFLILNKDKLFYELDAVTDTWNEITATPPISSHSVSAPIIEYGVVMYVSPGSVWLYKHTLNCDDCPRPSVPSGLNIQQN